MKLELDPLDLNPQYRDGKTQACPTSAVSFAKLTKEAQAAVRAVGRAVFYAWDRETYNAVYPPKATS